jgi:cellulose synthase/poly-beta-1,6-N-acetylglucosamine synthase-like glycosyltransferase
LISRCVRSVLGSAGSNATVFVVADNCTDQTAEMARKAGAQVLTRQDSEQRGKGYALRFAFDRLMLRGLEAFLVIDADSVVTSNLVSEALARLGAGADAIQCRYRVTISTEAARTRLMDLALMAFNVVRPRGRDRLGLSAGLLGNGFGLTSRTLKDVPYAATSVVEDLEYHLMLVEAGKRVEFLDQATVYGDMPGKASAARSQRSRWEGGRLRMLADFAPVLTRKLARGSWRLGEPLLELLTLPLAYYSFATILLLVNPLTFFRFLGIWGFAILAWHVATGVVLSGRPLECVKALAVAPFYIVWKIGLLKSIFDSARAKASWVRTARET